MNRGEGGEGEGGRGDRDFTRKDAHDWGLVSKEHCFSFRHVKMYIVEVQVKRVGEENEPTGRR